MARATQTLRLAHVSNVTNLSLGLTLTILGSAIPATEPLNIMALRSGSATRRAGAVVAV